MEQAGKSENLKHAISYIFIVALIIHFTEKKKTPELKKHIGYSFVVFGIYFSCVVLFSIIFPLVSSSILGLLYILAIGFLGYKAYIWEDVKLEFIENILTKAKK